MLQQVVAQTEAPMTFNIDAVDPDEILIVKSISGLSGSDLTLFTGEYARDGGYYQGRRSTKRNPVITFKLNPDYANDIEVSDIRELLYGIFYEPQASGDGVKMVLKDDRKPDRYFVGYTEDINTDLFAQSQEAQVSMLCTDPYLRTDSETSGTDAVGWSTLNLAYDGSAKTGIEVTIKVTTATSVLTFEINGVQLILNRSFAVNDVITINTLQGSRRIVLNGTTDIMASLASTAKWVQLRKGTNVLKASGAVIGDGKTVLTSYKYRGAWWGV